MQIRLLSCLMDLKSIASNACHNRCIIISFFFFIISTSCNDNNSLSVKHLTVQHIIQKLDYQYNHGTSVSYENGHTITSVFFPALNDFYRFLAGSRIHVYVNETKWVIVMELNGYDFGGFSIASDLYYFGDYIPAVETYDEVTYISNIAKIIHLNTNEIEYKLCENKYDMFLLKPDHDTSLCINGIPIELTDRVEDYENKKIYLEINGNGKKLIQIKDIVRYIFETNKEALWVKENTIRRNLPSKMTKLITIEAFYYDEDICYHEARPSQTELFQLLAKVIVTKDTSFWAPKEKPNNHWTNWER